MFAKGREAMRLTPAEVRLILIESLQWCANNAVYFLGLIGAATYDLAGTAFLVAAITLVRNLMTSAGNMVSGKKPGFKQLGLVPRPLGLFLDRWMVQYRKHGRFGATQGA